MTNDGRGRGAQARQEKRERNARWQQALREGRVVRIWIDTANPTLTACISEAQAFDKMVAAQQNGLRAEIVEVQ